MLAPITTGAAVATIATGQAVTSLHAVEPIGALASDTSSAAATGGPTVATDAEEEATAAAVAAAAARPACQSVCAVGVSGTAVGVLDPSVDARPTGLPRAAATAVTTGPKERQQSDAAAITPVTAAIAPGATVARVAGQQSAVTAAAALAAGSWRRGALRTSAASAAVTAICKHREQATAAATAAVAAGRARPADTAVAGVAPQRNQPGAATAATVAAVSSYPVGVSAGAAGTAVALERTTGPSPASGSALGPGRNRSTVGLRDAARTADTAVTVQAGRAAVAAVDVALDGFRAVTAASAAAL